MRRKAPHQRQGQAFYDHLVAVFPFYLFPRGGSGPKSSTPSRVPAFRIQQRAGENAQAISTVSSFLFARTFHPEVDESAEGRIIELPSEFDFFFIKQGKVLLSGSHNAVMAGIERLNNNFPGYIPLPARPATWVSS